MKEKFNPNIFLGSNEIFVLEDDLYWDPTLNEVAGSLLGQKKGDLYEWKNNKYEKVIPIDGTTYLSRKIPLMLRFEYGDTSAAQEGKKIPLVFYKDCIIVGCLIIHLDSLQSFEISRRNSPHNNLLTLTYIEDDKLRIMKLRVTEEWQNKYLDDIEDQVDFADVLTELL